MMKLIVEEKNGDVMSINIEYTPTEALVINHAMRRYSCDEDVNETDRAIMERMLKVEPIRQEVCEDCISRAEVLKIIEFEDKWLFDIWFQGNLSRANIDTAFGGLRGRVKDLPSVQPKTDVLDKIRAEIEEERVHDDWDFGQEIYYNNAIKDVLKIIDKYRESENKE